jgi:hypothetical protein
MRRRARTKPNAAFHTLKKAASEVSQFSPEELDIAYDPPVTEISETELASLAWQINPELCKKDLVAAIKLTIKTLLDIRKAKTEAFKDLIAQALNASDQKAEERRARLFANFRTNGRDDYFRVIQFITDEKNWDRALGKSSVLRWPRELRTKRAWRRCWRLTRLKFLRAQN